MGFHSLEALHKLATTSVQLVPGQSCRWRQFLGDENVDADQSSTVDVLVKHILTAHDAV